LGEGNFTFAAALAATHPSLAIVASSLESRSESETLWGAGPALAALREHGHAVLHGVDATALERSPLRGATFDAVLWLFPHSGAKGRVQSNRELISKGCKSVGCQLNTGAFEVALAGGQGGTAADGEAQRAFGDTWQIPLAAAAGGLLVTDAERFDEAAWTVAGYRASGCWRGLGKGTRDHRFRTREALVHTLRPPSQGVETPWPVTFVYHASFWIDNESLHESLLLPEALKLGRFCTGGVLHAVDVVNTWRRPTDGRKSICLRFSYCAPCYPLNAQAALRLHELQRSSLPKALPEFRLVLRTKRDDE
jgi:hypothetical protein